MARADFGGPASDFVYTTTGSGLMRLTDAVLTMWDAEEGGTQQDDLILNGDPVTTIYVTDGDVPTFQGPDGVVELWADAGGPRAQLVAVGALADAAAASATAAAASAAAAAAVGTTNDAIIASRVDDSVSATRAAARKWFNEGIVVSGTGIDKTGVSDSSAAVRVLALQAISEKKALIWPSGTYLLNNYILDGTETTRYVWRGQRSERGANAEATTSGYAGVKIMYRPADLNQPMIRAYNTSSPGSIIGPFVHEGIHFDFGDAHGMVFGVEDHANPTVVAPTTPTAVTNGGGQRLIFAVTFRDCALRGTNANRTSVAGVITRSGKRLLSLTKAFETKFENTSLTGGDTQIRTWGCDKPKFSGVRSQLSHLPFDLQGSGSFGVQHTLDDIQVEGWTFTPVRSRSLQVTCTNSRFEQNDGSPVGGGRYTMTPTAAVTADSGTVTFSASVDGILFPNLSLLELTDGTNTATALVTAVSGTSVTIDTGSTTLTWSTAAATAVRIHGYGPFHSGSSSATYTNISPGASVNVPCAVWQTGGGSMHLVAWTVERGAFSNIQALPLGNRHGEQGSLQGAMMFIGCSANIIPDPQNPFVSVVGVRGSYGLDPYAIHPNTRARYGGLAEAMAIARRQWVFTPKSAFYQSLSSRTPVVRLADEANTDQGIWAWHVRTGTLYVNDTTLPNNPANLIRVRIRARGVSATTLNVNFVGATTNAGPGLSVTTDFQTYEYIVAMPTAWQGVRTAVGVVGLQVTTDNVYIAAMAIEEITTADMAAFPAGVSTRNKAGTPTDADFTSAPPNGTMVIDSTGSKLWARVGGTWKSTTLT